MFFRTDLAIETREFHSGQLDKPNYSEEKVEDIKIIRINIDNDKLSEEFGKPRGEYITIEIPALTDNFKNTDKRIEIISRELKNILKSDGLILVVGLGNLNITPDALGPKAVSSVLATRHIMGEFAKSHGLDDLKPVAILTPGVLGQTGIESLELLKFVSKDLKPSAVVVIDALASRSLSRLGCTIQLSNTGISPGSGVGNSRPLINEETLGMPVISIGIPTVVDAGTLASDLLSLYNDKENLNVEITNKVSPRGESMMVTPREIDLLIERASKLLGMSINCALQPNFSPDDLAMLTST